MLMAKLKIKQITLKNWNFSSGNIFWSIWSFSSLLVKDDKTPDQIEMKTRYENYLAKSIFHA